MNEHQGPGSTEGSGSPPGSIPPGAGAPPPPPPSAEGGERGNPWDRRVSLGFGPALLENLKLFITAPGQAFRETRRTGDYFNPLLFAVLVGWVAAIVGQIWSLLLGTALLNFVPAEARDALEMFFAGSVVGFITNVILAPVFLVIGIFIWAGILHVCLLLLGGSSEAGFEATFRVVCYSHVASLAQVIPVFGSLIAVVWAIVLYVIGLSTLHKTTQGRALGAVFLPIAICCLCGVLVGLMGGVLAGALAGAG